MKGDRANKSAKTVYREGRYAIYKMGSGDWYVFIGEDDKGNDTGQAFATLREARAWCKQNV